MQKIIRILSRNRKNIDILKTLYINWKLFPIKDAVKLPIIVGKNVQLRQIGDIVINSKLETALITIGVFVIQQWQCNKDTPMIFTNEGTIVVNGPVKIYTGAKIYVKGVLTLCGCNNIGANTKIICFNRISLGYNTGCSWDCNIVDTNFHPLKDIIANRYLKENGKIVLGDNVFIGFNTYISMNTIVPDGCVISACSKVSGNLKKEGKNLLLSGNPATIVDTGYQMEDFCQFYYF